ncbi:MAG: N-acetylmuramic acid 6-phosphate etherase, partial [Gemmataceae bacterium]
MDILAQLPTEARNPASERLDELTSREFVELMIAEESGVRAALQAQIGPIAQAIDELTACLDGGGRLIYMGAGTSGRLGVLDAAECPPTFQTDPEQILGLIAGGPGAMFRAVEGAEDRPELGASDLATLNLTSADMVVGIGASGRTPYVEGGLRFARERGARTLAVVCAERSVLEEAAGRAIVLLVGPEVLTGSTRLKAGTATKLVLNMLTAGAMVARG